MRATGRGRQALHKSCGVLDIPAPVSDSRFSIHRDQLFMAAKEVAESSMAAAGQNLAANGGDSEPVDIAVSMDGT